MASNPLERPPLDLEGSLDALDRHGVRWVLTGSLVLVAYGARLTPNDIDVTPALDDTNLSAIAGLAEAIGAVPAHVPEWPQCPPLEWHAEWSPWPATRTNLDHLLVTPVGMIDIVPELCGTYDELIGAAAPLLVGAHEVLVAHPLSVLGRLEQGERRKDRARADEIERVRTDVTRGDHHLIGLDRLLGGTA